MRLAARCRDRVAFALSALLLSALAVEPPARSGDLTAWIETLAGGREVGDGGPAAAARLSLPGGVLVAPDGALIIVDFGNHRVRRVDPAEGTIETIAGTGEPGLGGDNGPAALARLARPENAAFSPAGDLYIVDSHNHRVRRIDRRTGIISTVAGLGEPGFSGDGGPALEARFQQPEGIAFDGAGNFYIGDTLNGRIRRVDAATGKVTTWAGDGVIGTSPDGTPGERVRFLRLARLASDAAGNLYIADSPSHKIHRLDARSRRLHTLAGTGEEGFSGDRGPAIRARLSYPEGVALDRAGNIFFADLGNHRVRRIDALSGEITTVAGCGERGFSGDGGPAVAARLWSPGRVALDGRGQLYVADILNARIRAVDLASGSIRTVAGSGDLGDGGPAARAGLAIPGDLALADGHLYVAEYGNRRVRAVDLATGQIRTVAGGGLAEGEGIAARDLEIKLPEAIAVNGKSLYVADSLGHRVLAIDLAAGTASTLAGSGEPGSTGDGGPARRARLNAPGAVAASGGSVFIGDFGNRRIRVVDRATETIRTLTSSDGRPLEAPVVSLAAVDGRLYWVASGDPDVYAFDLAAGAVRRLPLVLPYRSHTEGVFQLGDVVAAGSDLLVADTLAHRVVRLRPATGEVDLVAGDGCQGFSGDGGPAPRAALFRPGGLAAGADGEIYIADTFNHRVRRVRPAGPAAVWPVGPAADRVVSERLANGFRVIVAVVPEHDLLAVNLTVAFGALDDPPGRSGLAHLLEHLSLTGSLEVGSLDPAAEAAALEEVDAAVRAEQGVEEAAARAAALAEGGEVYGERLEALGAIGFNALTNADVTQYFARLPAAALATWMALEADRLRRPVFRHFLRERQVVESEILAMTGDRPGLAELFAAAVAPSGPGTRSVFGRREEVRSIDRPAALEAFRQAYRPDRMVLVVAGDVDPAEVLRLCHRHFGALEEGASRPAADAAQPAPMAAWGPPGTALVRRFSPGGAPVAVVGFPTPPVGEAESAALEAWAELINSEALSPVLRTLVRERRLAREVGAVARYPSARVPSLFLVQVHGSARTDGEGLAAEAVAAMSRLPAVPREDLEAAILFARLRQAGDLEDPASLASRLATYEALHGDWRLLFRRRAELGSLTPERMIAVARRYLTTGGSGPASPSTSSSACVQP